MRTLESASFGPSILGLEAGRCGSDVRSPDKDFLNYCGCRTKNPSGRSPFKGDLNFDVTAVVYVWRRFNLPVGAGAQSLVLKTVTKKEYTDEDDD